MLDMELYQHFKSLVDQDPAAVVICDTGHQIIYMNPAACIQYSKSGGGALVGKNLLDCHNERSGEKIRRMLAWFQSSPDHNRLHTFYNEKQHKDVYMIALRDAQGELIGYYEKQEYRDRDTTPLYCFD